MQITSILSEGYIEKTGLYIPQSLNEVTVWDTLATKDLLDAATSATSEAHAIQKGEPQIHELEREARDGILLDLGCGYGRIAEQLLPRRHFDAYIGVDSSCTMLRLASERKKDLDTITTPMYFVYGAIDKIPLTDASVDTVVVSAVFLHNHKSVTKKSIAEIYRILKPGGKLFVFGSFPNRTSLMGIQIVLYMWVLQLFGDPYRNGPVRAFGKREVQRLLKSYATVRIVPFGFALLPKRILVLPRPLNLLYMRFIANPINTILSRILPAPITRLFPMHHDVIATK